MSLHAIGNGVCAPTNFGGDCRADRSGAWQLDTLEQCRQRCAHCEGCNFVSFGDRLRDCSWYRECNVQALLTEGVGISSEEVSAFRTYAFRSATSMGTAIVQPDFAPIDVYCGGQTGGGIAAHAAQVEFYANVTRQFAQRHPRTPSLRVCEVGLHCGHSAMTFLEQDVRVHLTSFSLDDGERGAAARSLLTRRYGNRVEFMVGNTQTLLPDFVRNLSHGESRRVQHCDISVVDGRHQYSAALQDALALHRVARCGGLMLMDDVCDPDHCHAHTAEGKNHPFVIGPTQAWEEIKRLGLVEQVALMKAPDRGWVLGHILCRGLPRARPAPVRFEPDVPSKEQHQYERVGDWDSLQLQVQPELVAW